MMANLTLGRFFTSMLFVKLDPGLRKTILCNFKHFALGITSNQHPLFLFVV